MKITSRMAAAVFGLCAATVGYAQTVQGPVMGFVVDSHSRTLRPMLGSPGAAVVGDAVRPAGAMLPEAISPAGDYALVWMGTPEQAAIWQNVASKGGSDPRPIAGLPRGRSRVALSPEGTAAAFYSPQDGVVRVVSGLPGNPSDVSAFRLDTVSGVLASFAVSDDGGVVLCTAAVAAAEAIVLGKSGEQARIPLAGEIGAMAFVPLTHDAVIADGDEAVLVRGIDAHPSVARLNTGGAGAITSVAVTRDGRRLLLASASTGKIALGGLAEGAQTSVLDCHCQPEGLFRINSDGAWRLDGYRGQSVHVLDLAAATPRILVVTASMGPGNIQ